jgi:RNA polymerase sigma-70 factor (ECF subfamily)
MPPLAPSSVPADSGWSDRLLAGERDAWQEAVARHNRRVVVALLARRVTLDRAQDLAQEAWAMVMEQRERGVLKRIELPGLVIRQALFLAQDASRVGKRDGRGAEVQADRASSEPTPEENAMSRQTLARARRFISSLPPGSRRMFQLCCDGPFLSHAEAAERLDVSVQHVRQTLYEVRKELRRVLEEVP